MTERTTAREPSLHDSDSRNFAGWTRLDDGAAFILDGHNSSSAVWGDGSRVAWADGEGLLIVAPQGVGKTTLLEQVALAQIDVRPPTFLDLPIRQCDRVLYMAMDRPKQAQRSFRRMVTEADRELLTERLVVWRGPPPFNVVKSPDALAAFADEMMADTVILDSIKDLAPRIANDEVGSCINIAFQELIAQGKQLAAAHHPRKAQSGNKKPNTLDDVYGSEWITAGIGSVILLWGKPGDSTVELTHLKQPVDDIGPLVLSHNHAIGVTEVVSAADNDPLALLAKRGSEGATIKELTLHMFKTSDAAFVKRAQRYLAGLAEDNCVRREAGSKGGIGGGGMPERWYIVEGG
jgi:replicative DNA helicase